MFIFCVFLLSVFCIHRFFWAGYEDEKIVTVYFGLPGAGKSTFAAYLADRCLAGSRIYRLLDRLSARFPVCRRWIDSGRVGILPFRIVRPLPVYSNVPILGALRMDAKQDIGTYDMRDGKVIIDEAGIEFNNRNYKSMKQEVIEWFKLHRHYRMSVDVFSQSFEDMDITIRRLAYRYFLVQKSVIPGFIRLKRVYRRIGIDSVTHQFCDQYSWAFLGLGDKMIYAPRYYRYFDSYSAPDLLNRPWDCYERVDDGSASSGVVSRIRDRVGNVMHGLRLSLFSDISDCVDVGDGGGDDSPLLDLTQEDVIVSSVDRIWGGYTVEGFSRTGSSGGE